ncbi:acyl-CoA N-acyltransferase [Fomitiporia mediterranea MF3/22]|uniref:acyl-CoA N-acyltransferase n=1 Tax=Fomitiporia mediterranea (strain MF3/22) TaxID=694068 RepID=UPI00044099AB|nr:acyl-CoA N-acyltransferase [Fomitiporia mediterranea MF3/22]EJD04242.1 acyl-CoA N-acyltransferase [Fomitiporia mediterranea MF3/22]
MTDVGGPANPEASVNGSNGRKPNPRNFDKVIFGRWKIKTWYHSPYPISAMEDESVSVSIGPSKQGGTSSSNGRSQLAKRSNTRGRPQTPNPQNSHATADESVLWVCERCFKYMQDGSMLELHMKFCNRMHPPGKIVYKRGGHMIYEIDGAMNKLYCQNLSLFGKFFIDIKTLFFDCDNFMFYVLTEGDRHQDHVIGFFSKEKISYDDYNLACIITFPPYQRKRYGMLMIEFSYALSRLAGKLGTPERPLSELGLRTYLTYWTGALVQLFRRILSVQPLRDITGEEERPVDDDLIRFVEARRVDGLKKRRKTVKNTVEKDGRLILWESGLENEYNTEDVIAATNGAHDALYSQMRWTRSSANPDGSVTTHVFARCTLQDIANATGIRTEDVAFTLHECGLLQKIQALDSEEMEEVIVISREMVEQVAAEFKVKSKMCMEMKYFGKLQHVLCHR